MQNTKSNEEVAQTHLAHIAESVNSIEKMREQLSIIEFGMLKDIAVNNPDFEMHSKIMSLAHDDDEKQEIGSYLGHIVPVPMGYKTPAGSLNSAKMQEKIYASTKYLVEGNKVSSEKVGVIAASRDEMKQIQNDLSERLDHYAAGTPDKTMINPEAIQSTIDAGGDPYKKTESLVLFYGFDDKNGQPKAFGVNRTTGNQGEYPSYNFPNNDTAMSIVKGNPFTANRIIMVSGDLHNQALKENVDAPYKSSAITDDVEAATLAHSLNLNSKKGDDTAMIVVDVRSLEKMQQKLQQLNPNAHTVIYTDNQTDDIKKTLNDGTTKRIQSAAIQAMELAKTNSRSEELSNKHSLWLKPIKESLLAVYGNLKQRADNDNPDNKYQAKEQYRADKESIAGLVERKGKEQTDALRASFVGNNPTNSEDLSRKAERDSRLNARINPDARTVDYENNARPTIETTRQTIAADTPETQRIASPMR